MVLIDETYRYRRKNVNMINTLKFLCFALLGFLMPHGFTGRTVLKAELIRYGIPHGLIPASCITELATLNLKNAKLRAKFSHYGTHSRYFRMREALVVRAENQAEQIADVMGFLPVEFNHSIRGANREIMSEILQRHGVKF
ncbi:MAG: hypothetical protein IIB64_07300 [Proteobacteria bacterium]|nr:hypothetical protein [Pseudomonadota bacterium]